MHCLADFFGRFLDVFFGGCWFDTNIIGFFKQFA